MWPMTIERVVNGGYTIRTHHGACFYFKDMAAVKKFLDEQND